MPRQIIAIDLDDTLAATTAGILRHVAKNHGVAMQPGDITDSVYWSGYGFTDKQAIDIVHGYNLKGYPDLQVIDGAVAAVNALDSKYDLVLVTSRDPVTEASTHQWLNHHFGNLFKDVIFVGNKYVSKQVRSKADVCREYNAVILIDDGVHYALTAANAGIRSLLFGAYPWQAATRHPKIVIVPDWAAVERVLLHAAR